MRLLASLQTASLVFLVGCGSTIPKGSSIDLTSGAPDRLGMLVVDVDVHVSDDEGIELSGEAVAEAVVESAVEGAMKALFGLPDPGEAGNVTLIGLDEMSGRSLVETGDYKGVYIFQDLLPGSYRVASIAYKLAGEHGVYRPDPGSGDERRLTVEVEPGTVRYLGHVQVSDTLAEVEPSAHEVFVAEQQGREVQTTYEMNGRPRCEVKTDRKRKVEVMERLADAYGSSPWGKALADNARRVSLATPPELAALEDTPPEPMLASTSSSTSTSAPSPTPTPSRAGAEAANRSWGLNFVLGGGPQGSGFSGQSFGVLGVTRRITPNLWLDVGLMGSSTPWDSRFDGAGEGGIDVGLRAMLGQRSPVGLLAGFRAGSLFFEHDPPIEIDGRPQAEDDTAFYAVYGGGSVIVGGGPRHQIDLGLEGGVRFFGSETDLGLAADLPDVGFATVRGGIRYFF